MRVLVLGLERWIGIARMPKLLRDGGLEVAVLSPPNTFLSATRHRDALFTMPIVDGPHFLGAIKNAIDVWGAELIVPGDGSALSALQQIVMADESGMPTQLSERAVAVIRRSLPAPAYFDAATNKIAFAKLCRDLHIRVPESRVVVTMADLMGFAEEIGYPVVVKSDEGVAGTGVHICTNEDELAKAGFATLAQFRAHGQRLSTEPVSVERFIKGAICHFVSVSLDGKMLAGAAAAKIRCDPEKTGPAAVLQFIEPGEAEEFAGLFLAQTRFNGFASHDYILEEGTGKVYFIECNPRPVAGSVACKHAGVDLGTALQSALAAEPRPRFFLAEGTTVALYPQEVMRDPESEFLQTAIFDKPEDDPELLAAYEAFVERQKSAAHS